MRGGGSAARKSLLRGPDGIPTAPTSSRSAQEVEEERLVERENDTRIEMLADQIHGVKAVAQGLSDQAKASTVLTKDMDVEMSSTQSIMTNASSKIQGLLRTGSKKKMIYIILGLIVVFLIVYFMIK